jgi:hypothetical protein
MVPSSVPAGLIAGGGQGSAVAATNTARGSRASGVRIPANHVLTPGRLEEAFARVLDLHWDCCGILGADSVAMILSKRRRFTHSKSRRYHGSKNDPLPLGGLSWRFPGAPPASWLLPVPRRPPGITPRHKRCGALPRRFAELRPQRRSGCRHRPTRFGDRHATSLYP